jgi:ABC-2 type transport system permease protein
MNKTWIIVKREYLTRVTNKTFILSTILTPLLFAGIIGVSVFLAIRNKEDIHILVKDESGLFKSDLKADASIRFTFSDAPRASLEKSYAKDKYNGILYIPAIDIHKPAGVEYISQKQLGVISQARMESKLNDVIENLRMKEAQIDTSKLSEIRKNTITLIQSIDDKDGKSRRSANSTASYFVGYGSAFLIYIVLFIYGTMVMRGVMEEKTNRIAEVVVSSVRPFQLMLGKIIGIGAVGLTQFLIWIVLMMVSWAIIGSFVAPETLQQAAEAQKQMEQVGQAASNQKVAEGFQEISRNLQSINIPLILFCFVFYFLGGYLFYAALFAAVGSAVNDDPQDAQSLVFPITMPIVISIIIMINAVTNPSSPIAVWASIIPFSSPIVMMARIPFGVPGTVPYWQLGLSMLMLVAGFLFTTWLCAKIYRTGILLYGKKVTWKEMWKWAFRKN